MNLRTALALAAHENPELRTHLVPLLKAAKFSVPREYHLPDAVKGTEPVVPAGTDLAIWTYTSPMKGLPAYIAFAGKGSKPIEHKFFNTEEARDQHMSLVIRSYAAKFKAKQEALKLRKDFQHGLVVGTILYTSWGYDQTNVDFYEVTKVIGKMVEVTKIEKNVVSGGRGSDIVTPRPHRYNGPALKRIPQGSMAPTERLRIKINESATAWLWDGKPKHETATGWGH